VRRPPFARLERGASAHLVCIAGRPLCAGVVREEKRRNRLEIKEQGVGR
jgi:hypothetical protein